MQAEYALSFEEGCVEALRRHDEYVNEIVSLQASLREGRPDFSPYQKEVEKNYAYHVGLMISGCGSWYYDSGTSRYDPEGFIVPQYDKEEVTLPFDVVFTEDSGECWLYQKFRLDHAVRRRRHSR